MCSDFGTCDVFLKVDKLADRKKFAKQLNLF